MKINVKEYKPIEMIELISENDEVTFTYEDIKNAELNSYSDGFAQGKIEGIIEGELKAKTEFNTEFNNAKTKFNEDAKEILSQINQHLMVISESEAIFLEHFFPSVLKVCLAALQNIMPHFFQTNGKQEMEQILKNVIESLIIDSPIKITVSALVYDFILEHLQCSKYSKIIDIQKDQELTNEACKIEWDGGGAKWNLDESYKKIETKLLEIILREAL